MSDDHIPFAPVYGPPAPSGPRTWLSRRWPRAALATGVAVGLGVGGAGIAFAASSSSTTTPPATSKPPAAGRPHPFRFRGVGGLGALGLGGGSLVHGQATVRTGSGSYRSVDFQLGKVTAVSSTSITVTSTDGYTHSYTVASSTVVDAQRDGIGSVAKSDQVMVVATQSGNTATATNIVDTTKVQSSRTGFGFGPPRAPFPPGNGAGPAASGGPSF
jgi:hypothetical protein